MKNILLAVLVAIVILLLYRNKQAVTNKALKPGGPIQSDSTPTSGTVPSGSASVADTPGLSQGIQPVILVNQPPMSISPAMYSFSDGVAYVG